MKTTKKNPAAVALGSIKSEKKTASCRSNGAKGGRPPELVIVWTLDEFRADIDGRDEQGWLAFDPMPKSEARKLFNTIRKNLRAGQKTDWKKGVKITDCKGTERFFFCTDM